MAAFPSIRAAGALLRDAARSKRGLRGGADVLWNYLRYRLDRRRPGRVGYDPVFLQVEPTSRCNLRCPMCMRDKVGAAYGDMPFEAYRGLVDQLPRLYRLHLQGNGEPFLHPELSRFVRYARDRGVRVTVITNGTLVNEARAREAVGAGLNEIQFSVDSLDPATFEALRPGTTLEHVLGNLRATLRVRRATRAPLAVSMTVVIQRDNLEALESFVRWAAAEGVDRVSFQFLEPKHGERYPAGYLAGHSPFGGGADADAGLERVAALAARLGVGCDFVNRRHRGGCRWPWEGLYVTWDGRVTPCCLIFDRFVGDTRRDALRSIWNGDALRAFREELRGPRVPPSCAGCCHLGRDRAR